MHKRISPRWWLAFCLLTGTQMLSGAVFTVTNVNDSGAGSLRQALLNAGANAGPDTVNFQIPGPGPFSIAPTTALPSLAETDLDGASQPGYVNQPVIELNGLGAGASTVGLALNASNTIRGLAINRFAKDGIRFDGPGNVVKGCCLGTDVTGTIARGNGQYGIFIFGAAGNQVGGSNSLDRNVISGGNDTGIYLLNAGATGNLILGNYIGTSASGSNDLGNHNNGIVLFNAPSNVVGGVAVGARNIISGNDAGGVYIEGAGGLGNVIQGNYIGLAAGGFLAVSNTGDGITLKDVGGVGIGGNNAGEGNVISGNGRSGILILGNTARASRIEGNFIGTDATGAGGAGNAFAGVTLSGAMSNTIGGSVSAARNVISGNQQDGLYLTNATGNVIQGNFIGVNAGGTGALANQGTGVTLNESSFNRLAGDLGLTPSVVSANNNIGVWITGTGSVSNSVQGNFIGVAVGGTGALGNTKDGLRITGASFNRIGGVNVSERNVLSGNGFAAGVGAGVYLQGGGAAGNVLLGNRIGTDLNGLTAIPNRTEGLYLVSAGSNVIGSELSSAGNLISGNQTTGILLTNASGNLISGNLIGTRADGTTALGNGFFGIELNEGCLNNTVGGLVANAGNRIAFNGVSLTRAGVRVRDGAAANPTNAVGNAILGNVIFSNADLAVDIGPGGVTANDGCDLDVGGNQRQNFPVLAQAYSGVSTGVRGTLLSTANTTFRLQFFASPSCDASGYGEGQTYLGDQIVTTDGACSNNFVATLPVPVTPGQRITATATDAAQNTSEFSACLVVAAAPSLSLTSATATNSLALTWPGTATGFVLKQTTNLSPPVVWITVTNVPVVTNNQFLVTLARSGGSVFYRLSFE